MNIAFIKHRIQILEWSDKYFKDRETWRFDFTELSDHRRAFLLIESRRW